MRYFSYAGVAALSILATAMPARGAADNSQIATAGKQVHNATAAQEAARAEINLIRLHVKARLSAQPEWSSLLGDLRSATAALARARQETLSALAKDADYQALLHQRDDARAVFSSASDNQADAARVQKAGDDMIQSSFEIKRREDKALSDDAGYAAAKAKVDELRAKLNQLDAQVEQAVQSDPGYEPAMNHLKAAEQLLTTARQQLATAVQADRDQRAAKLKAEQQQDNTGY